MRKSKEMRFVCLRAEGLSYSKIAVALKVSKRTLIEWSKKLAVEVENLRQIGMEALQEEYLLGRRHRLKVLGAEQQKIVEEILKRDLSDVPTHRLFEIQSAISKEVKEETVDVSFYEEMNFDRPEVLRDRLKKRITWKG